METFHTHVKIFSYWRVLPNFANVNLTSGQKDFALNKETAGSQSWSHPGLMFIYHVCTISERHFELLRFCFDLRSKLTMVINLLVFCHACRSFICNREVVTVGCRRRSLHRIANWWLNVRHMLFGMIHLRIMSSCRICCCVYYIAAREGKSCSKISLWLLS